jgi:type I restriction enzyme, S subunit
MRGVMIMKYRYRTDNEMKESGVEWLGKIPKEWSVTKLKNHFEFEKGKNAALYTNDYIGLNEGNYPVYSGQTENNGVMGKINSYDYDLEKCIFTTTVGAKVMTPLLLKGKFNLSQNCLIMRGYNIFEEYIYYLLFPMFRYEKSLIPSYMQPSLRIDDLKKFHISYPDKVEQQKIASFLDKKTAEFDSIIEKKQSFITKLTEAKKSLISEVVTGKVKVQVIANKYQVISRTDDEMKDSGVEWLGKIPKEWEVKPLYIGFKENKEKNKEGLENNVLSLSYGKIKRRDIEKNFGLLPESFDTYQIVNQDYIIFRLTDLQNDKKSLRVGLVKEKGIITSAYVGLIPTSSFRADFSYYLFHVYDLKKIYYNLGSGLRQSMNFVDLKKMPIFQLSLQEQQQIVNFLDEKTAKIDSTIEKIKLQIEKLKVAKQSLISEAVTGKIEVMG